MHLDDEHARSGHRSGGLGLDHGRRHRCRRSRRTSTARTSSCASTSSSATTPRRTTSSGLSGLVHNNSGFPCLDSETWGIQAEPTCTTGCLTPRSQPATLTAPTHAASRASDPKIHTEPYRRERRSQLRGLLLLAAVTLVLILLRANRQAIFHAGWWRFWSSRHRLKRTKRLPPQSAESFSGSPSAETAHYFTTSTLSDDPANPTGAPVCVSLPAASDQCSFDTANLPCSYAYVVPSSV